MEIQKINTRKEIEAWNHKLIKINFFFQKVIEASFNLNKNKSRCKIKFFDFNIDYETIQMNEAELNTLKAKENKYLTEIKKIKQSTDDIEKEIISVKNLNKINYSKEYELINQILAKEKNGFDLMNKQTSLKNQLAKSENENTEINNLLKIELGKKKVNKLKNKKTYFLKLCLFCLFFFNF